MVNQINVFFKNNTFSSETQMRVSSNLNETVCPWCKSRPRVHATRPHCYVRTVGWEGALACESFAKAAQQSWKLRAGRPHCITLRFATLPRYFVFISIEARPSTSKILPLAEWRLRWRLAFYSNEVVFNEGVIQCIFRHHAIAHFMNYRKM